jgi:CheY-like chemotaxis protein
MDDKMTKAKYQSVMLIDDNGMDNFISRIMVEDSNFAEHVNIHTSAQSALDFLQNYMPGEVGEGSLLPDFIFIDLNMPNMSGFQFIEEFEKIDFKNRKETKIIMLTSSISQVDMDRAMKYRSVHKFLAKPLCEEYLEML